MNNSPDVVGPTSGLEVPRYAGLTTFARLPRLEDVEDYDIAIVGIPFDSGVTYRPGARFGPSHIRQSSRLLRPYNPSVEIEPFRFQQVVDAGDIAANPFDVTEAIRQIETGAMSLMGNGQGLIALGGDHTVSLPLLRAMKKVYGPIALVHFDAHLDTWPTYFGAPFTHGTPFRRASEEGLFDPNKSAHVGIRGSLYGTSDLSEDAAMGFQMINCLEVDRVGVSAIIKRLRSQIQDHPTYISVDIDVLDPAFAPGTGTPEVAGLSSRELVAMVRGFLGANIVGADVVEVSPAYDHAEITGIAAASLAYEFVALFDAARMR